MSNLKVIRSVEHPKPATMLICEQCGKSFAADAAWEKKKRFCSQACCGKYNAEHRVQSRNVHGRALHFPALKKRDLACSKCGVEIEDPREMAKHVVEAHGFKKVGAQVFASISCRMCPKPGLYKVGGNAYCKDHINIAIKRREVVAQNSRLKSIEIEREIKARDRSFRRMRSIRDVKRKGFA